MYINRALTKYDLLNFTLMILEYCESEQCIERENYYLNKIKPEYNTLLLAASSLGFKHKLATRELMSKIHKAIDRTGEKNHRYGITPSEETRAKLIKAAKSRAKKLEVLDVEINETTVYESIRAAARALDIRQNVITNYITTKQKSPFKGKYIFKKVD